jgi:hypothetical protein
MIHRAVAVGHYSHSELQVHSIYSHFVEVRNLSCLTLRGTFYLPGNRPAEVPRARTASTGAEEICAEWSLVQKDPELGWQ